MLFTILNHLKSQWYKYVIEVVVVILGILVAYNLEQWGGERDYKKKEIELLKEFKGSLSADLSEMRGYILLHEYSILSSKTILRVIKDNLQYHDSLDAYFAYTHAFTSFSGRVAPVDQLKNENVFTISNDSLRLDIISMYDEIYPRIRLLENLVMRDYERLRDFDELYFDAYDMEAVHTYKNVLILPCPWGMMHPIMFKELMNNPEYAALLRTRISNQMGLLRIHYKPSEQALIKLLSRIDNELDKLE